jgi:exosortase K
MKNDAFTPVLWAASAVILGSLKLWYPAAANTELLWILAPAAAAVSLITGYSFRFSPELGFQADRTAATIDAGCAGINFLIVLAAFSIFMALPRTGSKARRLVVLAALFCGSYIAAVLINAARISAALCLHATGFDTGVFGNADRAHLCVSIFIYAFFLILCSLLLNKTKERIRAWTMKEKRELESSIPSGC